MSKLTPHKVFLLFSIIIGFIIATITPPFQIADETNHFFRAYQIADGSFKPVKQDNRLGGYIPKSVDSIDNNFSKLKLNPYCKINLNEIKEVSKIKLNKKDVVFIDFPNTSLYNFVSYIPQIISIFILKVFNVRPFFIILISRYFTLAFWIWIIFLSIKTIPFGKWLFVVLALLPMSISTAASLSADVVTNAFSFLLIAYILKTSFKEGVFNFQDFIKLILLTTLLGFAKFVYVALTGLIIIIPKQKFNNIKQKISLITIIIIVGASISFINKISIESLYTPYYEYNDNYRDKITLGYKAEINAQIDNIIKNKTQTLKIFAKSFKNEFKPMVKSYIGLMGWGSIQMPLWFIWLSYFIIFLNVFSQANSNFSFNFKQKTFLILLSIGIIFLIMLSQYLSWDPVGSDKVYPLQGRYFIPVFPLLFLAFKNNLLILKEKSASIIVFLFIIISGTITIYKLSNTFYYNYNLVNKQEIKCNCEIQSSDKNYVLSSNDNLIKFGSKNTLTQEKSHSGGYSLKLDNNNQFGYTIALNDVKKGDKIIVSVWRLGKHSEIVFQEDVKNGFYFKASKIEEEGSFGWNKIQTEFFAPKDFTNNKLKIYIWYPKNETEFVDDFEFVHLKKQTI